MKIALLTDTHFGARNDSVLFHEYFMKFYNNVFFPELEKRNIDTVIHLGDVFDRRKYINYNILDRIKSDLFSQLKEKNINTHIIVGNHDTYYKNTNKVNSVKLLLGSYDNITIYEEAEVAEFDGREILMVPWINQENEEYTLELIKNTSALVAMGHLELSGFLMNPGMVNEHGLSMKVFDKFDKVYSGHFHHKSTNGNVTYLGNEYEITWIDYGDKRGFHIFDTETAEIEFIENPFTMFHKIFYDDIDKELPQLLDEIKEEVIKERYVKVIVESKTNPYFFDKFMDKIYKSNPADISIVEDIIIDDETVDDDVNLSEDTMTLLGRYVDELEIEADKNILKGVLKQLYMESLEVE